MTATAPDRVTGDALANLETALAALLSCLETPGTSDAAVEHAWHTVQHAFASVRTVLAEPAAAPRAAQLESCLRLYAVASAEVARRTAVLVAQRSACVAARQKLRASARQQAGTSCDVRA